MAYNDLRSFLQVLEDNGQLLRITEPVWPEPDIGAAASAANKGLGETAPALMFENIRGYQKPRLATNVHGSWPNMALMFGLPKDTPPKKQFLEFSRRYQNFSKGTIEEKQSAPWQEVSIEENINLYELMPHFRLNAGDGGLYFSKSSLISRHPDRFNEQNVGMYRFQVKGPNRLSGQFVPEHDIALHFAAAERKNKPLPIAITLGNDPLISLVAAMPLLYGQDEYQMASALSEAPCPVVTLKNGLQVPWGSEYVLEGHVLPGVREPDGPYGEFTGHLSGLRNMTSIEITKVWHRKEPIYEYTSIGMPWTEIDYIFLNTCPPLYVQLKEKFPEIEAVNALYTHGLLVIVSTKVRVGGFGKAVGMAVMTTPHGLGYAKVVIVVDEFVDPFNLPQVMWAMSTKVNPKYDTVIIPELSILPLDPGSEPPGMTHKLIIDATTPAPPEKHGEYSMQVMDPPEAKDWLPKLQALLKKK
jgi:vanillate/4-hydroxybenzoate decarboxylase subunit C